MSDPPKSETHDGKTPGESSASSALPESRNSLPSKPENKGDGSRPQCFEAPAGDSFPHSIDAISSLSFITVDNDNEQRSHVRFPTRNWAPPNSSSASLGIWKRRWDAFWLRNKGVTLVVCAQVFGGLMSVTTRLLETHGGGGIGMHPLQILFARMSITSVLCMLYMWRTKVAEFPLGKPEVRVLLVARGLGGFFGVFGLYYSLLYLPLSEATVLTFLAPILTCWACSLLINEPFTRTEQIAAFVSLLGVVLIARPVSFFASSSASGLANGFPDSIPMTNSSADAGVQTQIEGATAAQRMSAICMAMLGVLGAGCAYTTIRWIGKRAHPLISVNYFAIWCTIVSTAALVVVPSVGFKVPADAKEWFYLVFLGACGFLTQFLLTAGLSHEKSSRATNMTYTSMLFALAFDKIIWGITPGAMSILGSSLILGSAIYVAMQQGAVKKVDEIPVTDTNEEEIRLFQDCELNGNELNTFVQEGAIAPSRG